MSGSICMFTDLSLGHVQAKQQGNNESIAIRIQDLSSDYNEQQWIGFGYHCPFIFGNIDIRQSHKFAIKLSSTYWMEVFRLQIEPLFMQYWLCVMMHIKSQYLDILLLILYNPRLIHNYKTVLYAFNIPSSPLTTAEPNHGNLTWIKTWLKVKQNLSIAWDCYYPIYVSLEAWDTNTFHDYLPQWVFS